MHSLIHWGVHFRRYGSESDTAERDTITRKKCDYKWSLSICDHGGHEREHEN